LNAASYPSGANYYNISTFLGSPINGAVRAPIRMGGYNLSFWTGSSDTRRMTIDELGSIGIGTTTPNYLLDVSAAAASDSSFALSDLDVVHGLTTLATTSTYGLFNPISSTAGGVKLTALSDTDAQAFLLQGVIGSTNPTDTTSAIKLVGAKSNGTTGMADLGAAETVFQVANNATNALTILGNGNVGIGTVSPGQMLQVGTTLYVDNTNKRIGIGSSATAPTTPLDITVDGVGSGFKILGPNGNFIFQSGGVNGASLLSQSNSSTQGFLLGTEGGGTAAGQFLRFRTNGSERLTIDNNGNVGIGTSSPETTLNIHTTSGSSVRLTNTTSNNILEFGDTDNLYDWAFYQSSNSLHLWNNNANTTPFTISTTDRVGIGTTAPNYKLDIGAAAASDSSFALSDLDVVHGLTTLATTSTYGLFNPISSTAGGVKLTALSDTDAQAFLLQGVIGSTNPTDATSAIRLVGAKSNGTTGMADLGALETVFQVANNATNALTILGNGNVGIGTVSPSGKLELAVGTSNYPLLITGTHSPTGSEVYQDIRIIPNLTSSTDNTARLWGINAAPTINGSANYNNVSQAVNGNLAFAGSGTLTTGIGIQGQIQNSSTGIITNAYGGNFSLTNSGGGTITNSFGLYVGDVTSGTQTNQAYGLYVSDANASNYFAGNVGIGDTSPLSALTVGNGDLFQVSSSGAIVAATGITSSGTITLSSLTNCASGLQTDGGGALSCLPSDQSLKTNVQTISSALGQVLGLRGVRYNWTDTNKYGTQAEYGLIAQEVEQISPELVFTMGSNIKGVKYSQLTGLLVEAIKEQSQQIAELQALAGLNPSNSVSFLTQEDLTTYFANTEIDTVKAKTIESSVEIIAQTLTINGNATFSGNVTINGAVKLGNNNIGTAKIITGETKIHVTFATPRTTIPIISLTPLTLIQNVNYAATNITEDGFDIEITGIQASDMDFSWVALEK